jgi:hypothetical protein
VRTHENYANKMRNIWPSIWNKFKEHKKRFQGEQTKSLNSKRKFQVLNPPPNLKRFIYLFIFLGNGPLFFGLRLMARA